MILEWLTASSVAKINNQIAMNNQIVKVTANIQVYTKAYTESIFSRESNLYSKVVEQNESEDVIELISNNQFQGIAQSFQSLSSFFKWLDAT